MKKYWIITIILVVIIGIVFGFFLRDRLQVKNLESTDLSSLTIHDISLNQDINSLDLSKYNKNNKFEDKSTKNAQYRYFEDFLIVYDHNGDISKLQTISENGINYFADGDIFDLHDVGIKLGNNYIVKTYDSSQGLSSRVYYDKVNRTKASFIYPKSPQLDNKIVWVILEKY